MSVSFSIAELCCYGDLPHHERIKVRIDCPWGPLFSTGCIMLNAVTVYSTFFFHSSNTIPGRLSKAIWRHKFFATSQNKSGWVYISNILSTPIGFLKQMHTFEDRMNLYSPSPLVAFKEYCVEWVWSCWKSPIGLRGSLSFPTVYWKNKHVPQSAHLQKWASAFVWMHGEKGELLENF